MRSSATLALLPIQELRICDIVAPKSVKFKPKVSIAALSK
uniref:Uncharacterized protein n=1 Tax=Arundo donax TaxID=35708 RepID=A0A0A9GVY8_ARUDO